MRSPSAGPRESSVAPQAALTLAGRLESHRRSLTALYAAKHEARELGLRPPLRLPSRPLRDSGLAAWGVASTLVSRRPAQTAANRALRRISPPLSKIHRELLRVQRVVRAYRHAAHSAQNAIEVAVRGVGRAGVSTALLLLPAKVGVPLSVAVRAIERVVSRAIDLGLGR